MLKGNKGHWLWGYIDFEKKPKFLNIQSIDFLNYES